MKQIQKILVVFLAFGAIHAQIPKVELYSSRIDTFPDGKIFRDLNLILADIQKSSYETGFSKILNIKAKNASGDNFQAYAPYTSFKYRPATNLFASFTQLDLNSATGTIRYLRPSESNNSILIIDSLLQKQNRLVYKNDIVKIAVIDLDTLKSIKHKKSLDKILKKISKDNGLNLQGFKQAIFKVIYHDEWNVFDMMIYCEDPKNSIAYIDSLENLNKSGSAGSESEKYKVALFRRHQATNQLRIIFENENSIQDIPFNIILR